MPIRILLAVFCSVLGVGLLIAEDGLQAKACLLRHPHEDPSLLSSTARPLQQSFTNAGIFVNKKRHFS
jgi:hypothetical protein